MVEPVRAASRIAVAAWALAACLGVIAIVVGSGLAGAPTVDDYRSGRPRWIGAAIEIGLLLAPGLAAAIGVLAVAPLRRAARGFGTVAAAALATAAAAVLLYSAPAELRPLIAACPLLAIAAPLLRERGVISLAVVALPVAFCVIVARRAAQLEHRRAEQIVALGAVAREQARLTCIAVPATFDAGARAAIVRSLRPPFADPPIDVCVLPDGSDEVLLLQAGGFPLVALRDGHVDTEPARGEPDTDGLPFSARLTDEGEPVAFPVDPTGVWRLRVVTSIAAFSRVLEDPTHGLRLLGEDLAAYRASRTLTAGGPVLVRVDRLSEPGGSRWAILQAR